MWTVRHEVVLEHVPSLPLSPYFFHQWVIPTFPEIKKKIFYWAFNNKVQSWVDEIHCLATISLSQPQSAYSALTHGVMNRWNYVFRTCPDINTLLLPLEDAIRTVLLPTITGQDALNNVHRALFTLPCRLGGLNIPDRVSVSTVQYSNSLLVSSPLISLLLDQSDIIPYEH